MIVRVSLFSVIIFFVILIIERLFSTVTIGYEETLFWLAEIDSNRSAQLYFHILNFFSKNLNIERSICVFVFYIVISLAVVTQFVYFTRKISLTLALFLLFNPAFLLFGFNPGRMQLTLLLIGLIASQTRRLVVQRKNKTIVRFMIVLSSMYFLYHTHLESFYLISVLILASLVFQRRIVFFKCNSRNVIVAQNVSLITIGVSILVIGFGLTPLSNALLATYTNTNTDITLVFILALLLYFHLYFRNLLFFKETDNYFNIFYTFALAIGMLPELNFIHMIRVFALPVYYFSLAR